MKVNNIDRLLVILDSLAFHWIGGARAIGHTHAMQHGSNNDDCLVLSHNAEHARAIADSKGITIDALPEKLMGVRKPLLADHYAIGTLLRESAHSIRHLRDQIDDIDLLYSAARHDKEAMSARIAQLEALVSSQSAAESDCSKETK